MVLQQQTALKDENRRISKEWMEKTLQKSFTSSHGHLMLTRFAKL